MRLAPLALVILLAGCSGDDSPTAPSPPPPANVVGSYSGTLESSNYQSIALQMQLNQSGTTVTGTWASNTGSNNLAGNVTGTVDSSSFTGTITFSINQSTGCSGSFTGNAGGQTFTWTSPGFTGNCQLVNGNPLSPRFVVQRR